MFDSDTLLNRLTISALGIAFLLSVGLFALGVFLMATATQDMGQVWGGVVFIAAGLALCIMLAESMHLMVRSARLR